MRRLLLLAGLVLLAGCGGDPPPMPAVCSQGPQAVLRALARAPRPVRLAGGTRLSTCVERAYGDGELQELGFALTPAADQLAGRATRASAAQLGYLLGAVRRGAAHTNGIHLELVRRVEGIVGTLEEPALVRAARGGVAAGDATG